MSSSSRRHRSGLTPARTARVGSVVIATLLVSVAVMERSSSAFTAATDQQHGMFNTGAMQLTASDTDTMEMTAMVPGEFEKKCVDVTYTGTVPAAKLTEVKLRGNADGDLAKLLDVEVTMGAACSSMGTTSSVASGKLETLKGHASFETGYQTGWTPSGDNDKRGFEITVTLPDTIGNEGQGKEATASFAWEVQSKPSTP